MVHDEAEELSSVEPVLPTEKDLRQLKEEKELLEISMLDDIDDFSMEQLEKVEKVLPKPTPTAAASQPSAPAKTLSLKQNTVEMTIFNELQGIDFDTAIREEEEGQIDWNKVSCLCNQAGSFNLISLNNE